MRRSIFAIALVLAFSANPEPNSSPLMFPVVHAVRFWLYANPLFNVNQDSSEHSSSSRALFQTGTPSAYWDPPS